MTHPTDEELDEMARDLCHTGELSMPYRCEISDAIMSMRAQLAEARADLTFMTENRNKWQDSATQRWFRIEKANSRAVAASQPADPVTNAGCCQPPAPVTLAEAAKDVLAERQRQISTEGWTPEHDDTHINGEMAQAAACYTLNAAGWKTEALRGCWPMAWASAWFKPTDQRRDLVKAGALILAEIERLDRAALRAIEES